MKQTRWLYQLHINVGEHFVWKPYFQDCVYISPNKPFVAGWGLLFLLVAIIVAVAIVPATIEKLNWFTVWGAFFLCAMPLGIAITYLNRALKAKSLWFNWASKRARLHKGVLPLHAIAYLQVHEVPNPGIYSHGFSYQLSAVLDNGTDYPLVRNENPAPVQYTATLIANRCKLPLRTN